jgi:hypothetical protein
LLNPLARIMIKPFSKKRRLLTAIANRFFRRRRVPEQIFLTDRTYGLKNAAFSSAIAKFLEDNLNAGKDGKFRLAAGLYRYDFDTKLPRTQTRRNGMAI